MFSEGKGALLVQGLPYGCASQFLPSAHPTYGCLGMLGALLLRHGVCTNSRRLGPCKLTACRRLLVRNPRTAFGLILSLVLGALGFGMAYAPTLAI